MRAVCSAAIACCVALRKESVDRNPMRVDAARVACVALRKESVDRNTDFQLRSPPLQWSLSARRAWIEILMKCQVKKYSGVALRKESVDRNSENPMIGIDKVRRSPQGERG